MKGKSLILGVGNDILTDDAIGPKVTKTLQERSPLPGVDYETTMLGGLEILEFIVGYDRVVFIDAIKTKGGVPGDVYEFTTDDFKETHNLSNLHDISFLSALELGKTLKYKIPEDIYIFGVEIVEDLVYSNDFTPPVAARYEEIVEEIQTRLKEIEF